MSKVGLVLSGGGAKGAYHLGAIKAILEMGVPVDMIAGASIGALNGAILASAPDITAGYERMCRVWQQLSEQKEQLTQANWIGMMDFSLIPKGSLDYVKLLLSSGLRLSNPVTLATSLLFLGVRLDNGFLKDHVLQKMIDDYLDLQTLQHSIPFYVSVFPQKNSGGGIEDFLFAIKDVVATEVLGCNNQLSEFHHIQKLPKVEQRQIILASAAIPFLFKAHTDSKGLRFTDGGQGGMINSQGNTPIQPLIDAGCDHIIVVHLDGNTLWARNDFRQANIIEIRPSMDMGGFLKMFDFDGTTVDKLIQLGYKDANHALSSVFRVINTLNKQRTSSTKLEALVDNEPDELDRMMAKLRATKL